MKTCLLLIMLLGHSRCTDTTAVYICDSPSAKKYHLKSTCAGLSHCTHRIVKLTLEQAKKRGKTLCGFEK